MAVFVTPDSLLNTLDVASLYTNIPHADGTRATLHDYNESICEKVIGSAALIPLLKLVLQFISFEFNGIHYLQINGKSMGTPSGPSYANIFMGVLENEFLAGRSLKPPYYNRFIDDIFMIWQHGEAPLLFFIDDFSNANPSIPFSHTYSDQIINFLDVPLTPFECQPTTKIYRMPSDKQQ